MQGIDTCLFGVVEKNYEIMHLFWFLYQRFVNILLCKHHKYPCLKYVSIGFSTPKDIHSSQVLKSRLEIIGLKHNRYQKL